MANNLGKTVPKARRTVTVPDTKATALPVETGQVLTPPEMSVIEKHLAGETRTRAYAAVYGDTMHNRIRGVQFFARPDVQATLAAVVAAGLRDGLDSRNAFVADQHMLIDEARRAGQYGPAMSGRATLARVLGIDQGVVVGQHAGLGDDELLLQLRVALGPAVADAAARELLGDEGGTAAGEAS